MNHQIVSVSFFCVSVLICLMHFVNDIFFTLKVGFLKHTWVKLFHVCTVVCIFKMIEVFALGKIGYQLNAS